MSGWIKLEKSLLTDMRFRRMVDRYVEQSNALRNAAVTVMLGALAQLWLYADEHIHDDDTVRATTDDIDRFVGVDQFCSMVPKDWLVVLNPDQIQLPDFLAHNGTSARSRKLNAERQARFRHKHGNGKSNGAVTHSNARNDARPDQTRLSQTKTRPDGGSAEGEPRAARLARATRLPPDFELTPEREAYARQHGADPKHTFAMFTTYWRGKSGAGATKADWEATWQHWCLKDQKANQPKKTRFDQLMEMRRANNEE